jgi:hypothetical protein
MTSLWQECIFDLSPKEHIHNLLCQRCKLYTVCIIHKYVDLCCFVETWLQEHIPDQIVAAAGYNLIRRDRCVGQHGGVCAYVRKTIKYQVLENLFVLHRLLARRAFWDAHRTKNARLWTHKLWGGTEILFNDFPKYINISETK